MMRFNGTHHHRQQLLQQSQVLSVRLPDAIVNPHKLALLSLDDLVGTLAYLKRQKAGRER